MKNNIKLFGQELQDIKKATDLTKGISYTDADWNNLEIRQKGIIPGTPASSALMNTILRQAAFGAYCFGEILTTTKGVNLLKDLNTDSVNLTEAELINNYIIPFVTQLNKIQGLLDGDQTAKNCDYAINATNYKSGPLTINIEEKYEELLNDIKKLGSDLQQGNIIVDTAKNYVSGGNIDNKFKQFSSDIESLENTTKIQMINISINSPYNQGEISLDGYKRAGISYGRVKILQPGKLANQLTYNTDTIIGSISPAINVDSVKSLCVYSAGGVAQHNYKLVYIKAKGSTLYATLGATASPPKENRSFTIDEIEKKYY